MMELATRIHKLHVARTMIRFSAYAAIYRRDVLPHQRGHDRACELLDTLCRGFGHELLHTIDRERVQQWVTARRRTISPRAGRAPSARTVNREVDLLKAMLRDAVPKYLDTSPIAGMKRLKTVPPKRRLMTPAEERKILVKLEPEDRAIVLIGLDCLIRMGDILDLRREDDRRRALYVSDPKDPQQSTAYEVPISKRVRAALDALPDTGPYFFTHRRRGKDAHARGAAIRAALKRACKLARVPYGRANNGITFHWGTRRTGATRMLQRGAELKAVQAVGHWKRPDVMLEIYAETTTQAQRKAVELVFTPGRLPKKANAR